MLAILPVIGCRSVSWELKLKRNGIVSLLQGTLEFMTDLTKFKVFLRCLCFSSLLASLKPKTSFLFTLYLDFNVFSFSWFLNPNIDFTIHYIFGIIKRLICLYVKISCIKLRALINLVTHLIIKLYPKLKLFLFIYYI